MWQREALKYYAKEQLRYNYGIALGITMVGMLLGGAGAGSGGSADFSGALLNLLSPFFMFVSAAAQGSFEAFLGAMATSLIYVIQAAIIIALVTFLSNPISVGVSTWFIAAPRGYSDFGLLFSAFQEGRYLRTVKTMFMVSLSISLWTLLFIVPGIIKSYEYRMVPYLVSDHPYLTPDEAKAISKTMTEGQKFDMWVLDLSFVGWALLGVLAMGIGVLFVIPYIEATWAQLYYVQRQYITVPPPPSPGVLQ